MTKRMKALLAGALMGMACASAQAQSGPTKILVGFPAGGAPDLVARAFADQLRNTGRSNVIVENRAGASGKVAIDVLLAEAADGRTLAVIPSTILILLPKILKSARFDAVKDFAVVGSLVEYGFGVAAGPAVKAGDFNALVEEAKKSGARPAYGTPGVGTPQHFLGAQLKKDLGVDFTHVPYKGGAAALGDLVAGHIPLMITTEQLLVPLHRDGKLRAMLVTSRQRNAQMPDVPTARELGLPQLEAEDWFGLFAKQGTPTAAMEEWRGLLKGALAAEAYRAAVGRSGYAVPARQEPDYAPIIARDTVLWAERVKASGFEAGD